jgi:peptidoglycan/xylan/chitin deacetylase (PgdA/CDA1 family)
VPSLLAQIQSANFDSKSVAITFDDACYGVYLYAFPLLAQLDLPATVFVVSDHVFNGAFFNVFHFDAVEISFRLSRVDAISLDFMGKDTQSLKSEHKRVRCMKKVKGILKTSQDDKRRGFILELFKRLEVSHEQIRQYAGTQEKYRTMSKKELENLLSAGWSLGGHTRSHRTLSMLKESDLENEIRGSYGHLKRTFGLKEIPFAYPYGEMRHIGLKSPGLVRSTGFTAGFTAIPKVITSGVNPYLIPRMAFLDI